MSMTKRGFLGAAAAVLMSGTLLAPAGALAQEDDYPNKKNITVVCAFPAGSGADVLVRYFGQKLQAVTDHTVIVENKPGAAGNIAAQYVANADPDGYTIYVHAGSSTAANYHLYNNPPFKPDEVLQVAATLNQQPFMVVVPKDSPYKTLAELTAAMKEKGDKANWAQTNTTGQVMGKLYIEATGIEAVEIPYSTGADTLNDMTSGRIDYMMADPVYAIAQARQDRVRMLAVSTPERMKAVPELPTMTEAGTPGVEMRGWFAAMVPIKTPRPVVDKINAYFKEILEQPETVEFLALNGGDPFISTPDEGQALLKQEMDNWEDYVERAEIEKKG